MVDLVLGIIGDSPAPPLALVNSNIAEKYIFLYTMEMKENAALLKKHLFRESPGLSIELLPLPSMNNPTDIVKAAKEFVAELSQDIDAAIFVTAGAKQVTLPFYIHAPWLTRICLKEGRLGSEQPQLFLLIQNSDGSERMEPTSVSLEQMLAIRGWVMKKPTASSGLMKGEQHLANITVDFNQKIGRLTFFADSYVDRKSLTKPFSQKQKNEINTFNHDSIGQLVILSKSFGRNGAAYSIRGDLSTHSRNVLPYFIQHTRDIEQVR